MVFIDTRIQTPLIVALFESQRMFQLKSVMVAVGNYTGRQNPMKEGRLFVNNIRETCADRHI